MKERMLSKGLVVGVILLFIGVAVQPSIATVQTDSIDVEYFDVTTEFIGLGKKHTIQFTREQSEKLDRLFVSINDQLDKVETREETMVIFNDAVVELDKYGLLGGLSIEQTQRLVTGRFQNSRIMTILNRNHKTHHSNYQLDDSFCSIVGSFKGDSRFYPYFFYLIQSEILFPLFLVLTIMNIIPFLYGLNSIAIMGSKISDSPINPEEGWVQTVGMNGKQIIEGSFYGRLGALKFPYMYGGPEDKNGLYYIGIIGFTGIRFFNFFSDSTFFIGRARRVALENI